MKLRLHLGNCSKCNSGLTTKHKGDVVIKADWVMCYRLPIRFSLGGEAIEPEGTDIEVGRHVDLCLHCIVQAFEAKNKKD